MTNLVLHNYFRSSTSIRVRVALNLKRLEYQYASYALLEDEHKSPAYLEINPQGKVPSLQISPDKVLGQSLAIIEYLDELYPEPALMPSDPWSKAQIKSLALIIACEIHPLNNLAVLKEIRTTFGADDQQVRAWFHKWVHSSFVSFEQILSKSKIRGQFCCGDQPGLADICLYAQMLNNQRFDVDTSDYPLINQIFAQCQEIEAFDQAHPKYQPDAT